MMKVYCINLKRSVDRRAKMEVELGKSGLDYEFIEAVDGRSLGGRELKQSYCAWRTRLRNGTGLSPSEVGCAMSHLRFFEIIRDSVDGVGLVLEDDVVLGPEFGVAVQEAEVFLLKDKEPMLVQLPGLDRDLRLAEGATDFVRVTGDAMGAYAYAINRSAAELLVKAYTPIKMPSDKYGYLIKRMGLHFYVYPKIVLNVDMHGESTIGQERFAVFKGPMKVLYKLWRCLGVVADSALSRKEWQ